MSTPLNCHLEYHPNFLSKQEAQALYREIYQDYQIAELTKQQVGNQTFTLPHGKLMFIDQQLQETGAFPEEQWGRSVVWSERMREVKERVAGWTGIDFGVCVCIYYPNGQTGVDFHSDFQAFGDTSFIPSLSLGEERNFLLREKSTQRVHEFFLEEGSMLIMGEHCQERYEHSLPIDPSYKNGRINLTFRQYGFGQ
ncbi:MAG: alpha-ketoglutarate-dependent dioxygenase AlkB [Bacteroidota bacterium]